MHLIARRAPIVPCNSKKVFLFHFEIAFGGDVGSAVDILEGYDLETFAQPIFQAFPKATTSVVAL